MLIYEPRTVLMIEDSADDEQLALRAIRDCNMPLMVKVARDGEKAISLLNLIQTDPALSIPDLVICDMKLPKLHGHEVLRMIRDNPKTATVPVVIFSSSNEPRDITKCYSLGANSYVRKPVGYDEYLLAVVQIINYWIGSDKTVQPKPFCEFAVVSADHPVLTE